MYRVLLMAIIASVAGLPVLGGEVWKSTFDTDADGIVDLYTNNPSKVMIGANLGGQQEIIAQDSNAFPETDRVGRPLGTTLNGHSEYSALFTFSYGSLPADGDTWTGLGFTKGDGSNPGIARQFSGSLLRNQRSGDDYVVLVGLQWGSSSGQSRSKFVTPAVNLGPDPFSQTFQLAISYLGDFNGNTGSFDDGTGFMQVSLFDANGNLLTSVSYNDITNGDGADAPLLTGLGGEPGSYPQFLSNQQLTHLGAMDYKATGAGRNVVYLFDSLGYYDTVDGAINAVVPEPMSGLILLTGIFLTVRRRSARR